MPAISKPNDLSVIWASSGDVVKPSNTKINGGWTVEVPPHQWFNWLDNRQDQAIGHINQYGIAQWDSGTEYQAGMSHVLGSNGIVYKCKVTNTNNNPVVDLAGAYWKQAFFENTSEVPSDTSVTLPGGIVYKWGQGAAESGGTITFDEPFGSEVLSIVITHGPGADNPLACAISSWNLSGFTVLHENGAALNGFSYFAIGKD